ncbi:conserved protein of unknown function [Tenacibaculum sp. 190524A02b]|uniref:Flagellar biosynthetic protein FliQ n=1 Tax=Tenacibaculum vairaonense TaxID=3137860 RepID=A0ABM9PLW8_9FLAO
MSNNNSIDSIVKKLLILLLLLITSPIMLNIGFKALKVFNNQPKVFIAYILIFAGFLLILCTVYHGFKTFKGILDLLFNN